jgi:hypothetical protein
VSGMAASGTAVQKLPVASAVAEVLAAPPSTVASMTLVVGDLRTEKKLKKESNTCSLKGVRHTDLLSMPARWDAPSFAPIGDATSP